MIAEKHREYGEEYFLHLRYSEKGQLISKHVLSALRWGSGVAHLDLLKGMGKSALDVGCAFGYGVSLLDSLGYDGFGTDVSVYGISEAKKTTGKTNFAVCDVQKHLPFREKFNLITCFEVLEHLRDPLKALQNMYDACDGVILCTTPNKAIERVVKRVLPNFDTTHLNVKAPQEWERLICSTLDCNYVKIDCFLDMSFRMANKWWFRSFKLPFGMDTRILIKR